jgi:hypothetical protein
MKAMGFDSLMSLELRTHLEAGLGLPLSPTIAFNYPTVCALAEFLAEKLGLGDDSPPTAPADDAQLLQIVGELAQLVSGEPTRDQLSQQ